MLSKPPHSEEKKEATDLNIETFSGILELHNVDTYLSTDHRTYDSKTISLKLFNGPQPTPTHCILLKIFFRLLINFLSHI